MFAGQTSLPEMDSVEELYAKLQLLSEQWRQNTSELGQLQEKAAELQAAVPALAKGGEQALAPYAPTKDDDRIRFKELQKENRILSQLVKQHESTLEVVMSKFRLQTVRAYEPATKRQCC
nr:hypothetical protein HK105_004128 [Polyrhizophydium stewartii]